VITSRNYDFLLGGNENYAADRAAAEAWLKVNPDAAFTVWANVITLLRGHRVGMARVKSGWVSPGFLDVDAAGRGLPLVPARFWLSDFPAP
jgi:hypothetical protein